MKNNMNDQQEQQFPIEKAFESAGRELVLKDIIKMEFDKLKNDNDNLIKKYDKLLKQYEELETSIKNDTD